VIVNHGWCAVFERRWTPENDENRPEKHEFAGKPRGLPGGGVSWTTATRSAANPVRNMVRGGVPEGGIVRDHRGNAPKVDRGEMPDRGLNPCVDGVPKRGIVERFLGQ
jgi:hypothetical protein